MKSPRQSDSEYNFRFADGTIRLVPHVVRFLHVDSRIGDTKGVVKGETAKGGGKFDSSHAEGVDKLYFSGKLD